MSTQKGQAFFPKAAPSGQHQSKKYDCKTQGYRLGSVRESNRVIGFWSLAPPITELTHAPTSANFPHHSSHDSPRTSAPSLIRLQSLLLVPYPRQKSSLTEPLGGVEGALLKNPKDVRGLRHPRDTLYDTPFGFKPGRTCEGFSIFKTEALHFEVRPTPVPHPIRCSWNSIPPPPLGVPSGA